MAAKLTLEGKIVSGEVRLDVHPAMSARDRDRALDAELSAPLTDIANELGVVLAGAAHRFAKPLPGKDDEGKMRFAVRGRAEGDRLVPERR